MSQDDNRLQHIQALQFRDRPAAEALLLTFVRDTFPSLDARTVELRPLAVSLNSFNGFVTLSSGRRLFFKTHVEPGSVIDEYYNTSLLAKAGYSIIQPVYASTDYGKQFLIYEVIDSPSVFDVARAIERGERADLPALTTAQRGADDDLLRIYQSTLEPQTAGEAGKAAVHQLFHHRLGARYAQFYAGKSVQLPGITLTWDAICRHQWVINGIPFTGTIGQAVEDARVLLEPDQPGWSVIGHGDAHNGNVFFTPDGLVYFDPAFGGRHHPLLDLIKPLFHNVFATWMYHPAEIAASLHMTIRDNSMTFVVEHDYRPSDCRRMFFESKMKRVVKPLIQELSRRGGLPPKWRTILKLALMCCPLLTMNLIDSDKFPPPVALLGLCYVVEMGLESSGHDQNWLNQYLLEEWL